MSLATPFREFGNDITIKVVCTTEEHNMLRCQWVALVGIGGGPALCFCKFSSSLCGRRDWQFPCYSSSSR